MKADARLERAYKSLLASERARLVIAAAARSDTADVERLMRTCPRLECGVHDPGVCDRLDCAFDVAIATWAMLETIAHRIDGIQVVSETGGMLFLMAADGAEHEAWEITGALQPSIRQAVEKQSRTAAKLLCRTRRVLRVAGASVADAFGQVCRDELEVDPHDLLAAVSDTAPDLYDKFTRFAPDPADVESIRSELSDHWRTRTG